MPNECNVSNESNECKILKAICISHRLSLKYLVIGALLLPVVSLAEPDATAKMQLPRKSASKSPKSPAASNGASSAASVGSAANRTQSPATPEAGDVVQNQKGGSVGGKSLEDAFKAALVRSETVSIQSESVKQAGEVEGQAKGTFLPLITGTASIVRDHYPSTNPITSINNGDLRTSKLSLDQPLFRGLKDFASLRQKKALVQTQVFTLRDSARQLFNSLSVAYYNVLILQSDEQNYMTEIEIYNKRVEELKHFLKIGRSRETDLLTFETSLSTLRVQLESTRGQLETAKDILAYYTGWQRDTLVSDQTLALQNEHLPDLLGKIDDRPDVQSALANSKAAAEGVPIARSGHLPSVDLIANYYYDHPTYQTGSQDWDLGVTLTLPIYAGGVVQSQVRQAQSVSTQSELQLSSVRRLAEQEIRTDFDAYQTDLKQVKELENSVQLSQRNYQSELRDYRNGLVTNLDVLTAINSYQDSQRLLDRQKWTLNLDRVKLEAATGQRSEIAVHP